MAFARIQEDAAARQRGRELQRVLDGDQVVGHPVPDVHLRGDVCELEAPRTRAHEVVLHQPAHAAGGRREERGDRGRGHATRGHPALQRGVAGEQRDAGVPDTRGDPRRRGQDAQRDAGTRREAGDRGRRPQRRQRRDRGGGRQPAGEHVGACDGIRAAGRDARDREATDPERIGDGGDVGWAVEQRAARQRVGAGEAGTVQRDQPHSEVIDGVGDAGVAAQRRADRAVQVEDGDALAVATLGVGDAPPACRGDDPWLEAHLLTPP